MSFPSFKDFRETLTEERLSEIFSDIYRIDVIEINGLTPENINAFISKLRYDTIGASISASLALLEAYHEWLSQELSGQYLP